MKRFELILTGLFMLLIFSNHCTAQQFSMTSGPGCCQPYACRENKLWIVVPKSKHSEVIVTTDNGRISKLEKSGDSTLVAWLATKVATSVINVDVKVNGKITHCGSQIVKIGPELQPTLRFLGKAEGAISKSEFNSDIIKGPVAYSDARVRCGHATITQFDFYVTRKGEVIFSKEYRGTRLFDLDFETGDFLKTLRAGDKLFFTNFRFPSLCGRILMGDSELQFDIID